MSDRAPIQPLALNLQQTAELLGIDPATVRRNSRGDNHTMPKPVNVSAGALRWRFDELRDWLQAGCPAAAEWSWPAAVEGAA